MATKIVIGHASFNVEKGGSQKECIRYWMRVHEGGKARFTWDLGGLDEYGGDPINFKNSVLEELSTSDTHDKKYASKDGKWSLELSFKLSQDKNGRITARSGSFTAFMLGDFLEALKVAEVVKWDCVYNPLWIDWAPDIE